MAPLPFVITLDETHLDSLHQTRTMTESGLVREAARNITDRAIAKLDEMIAAGFALTGNSLGIRALDQEFQSDDLSVRSNPKEPDELQNVGEPALQRSGCAQLVLG
jgi:DNA-binding FadR family transcriptional regulator